MILPFVSLSFILIMNEKNVNIENIDNVNNVNNNIIDGVDVNNDVNDVVTESTTVTTQASTTSTTATTTTTTTTTTSSTTHFKMEVAITAYCSCEQCCGYWAETRPLDDNGEPIVLTASGAHAKPNHTIAVDTSIIPFGSIVIINGNEYVAEDTGSAIVGNKIDMYFDCHEEALEWGYQEKTVEVYI